MGFLRWYLQHGLPGAWEIGLNYLAFVKHFFSLGRLSGTLVSPWKKTIPERKPGLGLGQLFYEFSYDLISRLVGMAVRLAVLAMGLSVWLGALALVVVVLDLLVVFPPLLLPHYLTWRRQTRRFEKAGDWDELLGQLGESGFGAFMEKRTGFKSREWMTQIPREPGRLGRVLSAAGEQPSRGAAAKVTAEGVFLALLEQEPRLAAWWAEQGIEEEDAAALVTWFRLIQLEEGRLKKFWRKENLLSIPGIGKDWEAGYTPGLDTYCQDLSREDLRGFSFVGREHEVEGLIAELTRSHQPDILLVGEPGMGRHTLVRGLAKKIQWHEVPDELHHQRILVLRSEKFLADTAERNAGEELYRLLYEAEAAGNVILVIDGFEQLFVKREGEHDLSGPLARILESDRLRLIAVTDRAALARYLRPQKTVMKYFSSLELSEMAEAEAMLVLFERVWKLESGRTPVVSYQGVREMVRLAANYIRGEAFPEKALDVLERVVAAAEKEGVGRVEPELVRRVVSQMVHVPVAQVSPDEGQSLLTLEAKLHRRIVEQDEAVEKIAKAIRRSRVGIGARNKPMGSFIFLGPTGVGKTEAAKVLSQEFFQTEDLVRFDMAGYQSKEGVERLIGSLEQNTPGDLAEKIQSQPYGVVLLDEFEKAPREIHHLFLAILDEGSFTSAGGQEVDCRNLLFIATSNAGSEHLRQLLALDHRGEVDGAMVDYVLREGWFVPELLNRFDGVVWFKPLSPAGLRTVARKLLAELLAKVKEAKKIEVEFGEGLVERIVTEGYDPVFGARSIQHYINDEVGDELAKRILANPRERKVVLG